MKYLLLAAMFIGNLSAQTVSEAEGLYSKRGESNTNALKAAEVYKKIADAEKDAFKKADLSGEYGKATYYYAQSISDKKEREELHKKAYEYIEAHLGTMGITISKKIEFTKDYSASEKAALAKALYQYSANLGKWGETKGIGQSLFKLPLLKGSAKAVKTLDNADHEFYGADRILARADYKTGKKQKGYLRIKQAVDNTLVSGTSMSGYGLNNIYLAEFSDAHPEGAEAGKTVACKILKEFSGVNPETYNASRVPETTKELEQAKNLITKLKCN